MSGSSTKIVPQLIEPRKFCVQRVDLVGSVATDALLRLLEFSTVEQVSVDFQFDVDDEHRRIVRGVIAAELTLNCQRCLGPLRKTLEVPVSWGVVWNEEKAKQLPERIDPWIAGEESADLYAMVEEELLLVLPSAPMHDELCISESLLSSGDQPEQAKEPKVNPFQVLEQLKGKNKH